MKKIYLTLAGIGIAAIATLSAGASGPGPLTCFSGTTDGGYNGTCVIASDGTATLNNIDGDSNPTNNYSGVYYPNDTLKAMLLSSITKLSFSYTGTTTAASPRISLPIDTNNDGVTEFYAFISAQNCNDGAGNVNPLTDSTCTIYAGSETFANWAALLAAHPDWKVGNNATFVVADDPGIWTVSNVVIGDAPAVEPSTVKVTIDKFINGSMATASSSQGYSFPMSATWNSTSTGAGTGTFNLSSTGFNSSNAFEAITADMTSGASYSTNEVTGGATVGTSCTTGQPYSLAGYTTGNTFAEAASGTPSLTMPAFTNMTANKYVIVWNVSCNGTTTPPVTHPTEKDQCKDGGWKSFTNPSYKNQGQCVSSVVSNRDHQKHQDSLSKNDKNENDNQKENEND